VARVYTELFFEHQAGLDTFDPVFTVPTTGVWILRDVVASNFGSTPGALEVLMSTGVFNVYYLQLPAVEAKTGVHLELRQVLTPGRLIYVHATHQFSTFSATGYHLLD